MSTKSWIGSHTGENGEPSWGLYKDVLEREVVYLELKGVQFDVRMIDEKSPTVLLRLPEGTARQLGLLRSKDGTESQ
ncbi:hypothetical protein SAMN05414139_02321 [Burkholderia sp. D7]|nr:hypothetical protein SAMN05414139_02321 [Burkholderia sp. D7]